MLGKELGHHRGQVVEEEVDLPAQLVWEVLLNTLAGAHLSSSF
tara:strand:- start:219 stop:347 length:129 start_codon:yes stop_codon:yes gene_type:complete